MILEQIGTNGPNLEATQGYDENGTQIDMTQLGQPINPGQDIVLYAILDPNHNPGEGDGILKHLFEHKLNKAERAEDSPFHCKYF
jgi:hypothetical protein